MNRARSDCAKHACWRGPSRSRQPAPGARAEPARARARGASRRRGQRAGVAQPQQRGRVRARGLECAAQRVGRRAAGRQLRAAEGHQVQAERGGGRARGGRLATAARRQQQHRQARPCGRGVLSGAAALCMCPGRPTRTGAAERPQRSPGRCRAWVAAHPPPVLACSPRCRRPRAPGRRRRCKARQPRADDRSLSRRCQGGQVAGRRVGRLGCEVGGAPGAARAPAAPPSAASRAGGRPRPPAQPAHARPRRRRRRAPAARPARPRRPAVRRSRALRGRAAARRRHAGTPACPPAGLRCKTPAGPHALSDESTAQALLTLCRLQARLRLARLTRSMDRQLSAHRAPVPRVL